MKLHSYYVYIMTNKYNRVLYTGITRDLARRIDEHKRGAVFGFTKVYNIHKLIYFEIFDTAEAAIGREKQLKRWHHEWKLNLTRQANPHLKDLSDSL